MSPPAAKKQPSKKQPPKKRLDVGLFVTCLVDLMRPGVGFAAVHLLEAAGCRVGVPLAQTCCGQPAYNSGDFDTARAIALQVLDAFDEFEYVVVPSGSCAGMIRHHYPVLFEDDSILAARAGKLAARTFELTSFLHDVAGFTPAGAVLEGTVAYHDGCAGLREMKVRDQPRALLSHVLGLTLKECQRPEACCGFGGLFCLKYGEISARIVDGKADDIAATGAATLLGGDLGCLMNIAGRLRRRGEGIEVRHVAEVLAGMDLPPIGEDG